MTDTCHSADDADLRYYVGVARRRLPVIVVLAVLLPAVSLVVASMHGAVYAASAEVLIKRENLAGTLTNTQFPYTDGATAERLIDTQVELARVPSLVARVISAAGGSSSVEEFLRSSSVVAKPNTDILVLTVESPTPALAMRLAAAYAKEFTHYRRELDRSELDAMADELRTRLATMNTAGDRGSPLRADLEGRLRQVQTLQALQTSSAVVVREADTAEQTKPKRMSILAGGLVLGVILGVGVAFLIETLDNRVRTSAEAVDRLGLPLLGRLPPPPKKLSDEMAPVALASADSQAMEAFTFLRTTLHFANRDPRAQLIMVTSTGEQEGKSSTAANLAVALARSGSRVALVDFDFRRPTIHRFFRIPQEPGAVDVASGSTDLDDAIVEVVVASAAHADGSGGSRRGEPPSSVLQVLPFGAARSGVDVASLAAVTDRLRLRADLVLVDAPPLLQVGEVLALSAEMDAVMIVVRLNMVRRPALAELRRVLDAGPVRVLGVVCTGSEERYGHHTASRSPRDERLPGHRPTEPASSKETVLAGAQRQPSTQAGGPAPTDE